MYIYIYDWDHGIYGGCFPTMNGWCWKFPNPKKNTVKRWLFSQQKLPSVQQKVEDVEQKPRLKPKKTGCSQMRSLVGKKNSFSHGCLTLQVWYFARETEMIMLGE